MQIQINTDHNIEGHEALSAHIRTVVDHAMAHEAAHITRIQVHLQDENGPKNGPNAMRCAMQARLERHQPLDVTCDADSMHQAIAGAADKLRHLVEHTLEKERDEKRHRTDPLPPPAVPVGPS
jgi:ribosome-associated translation inhibitor RaiA